MQTNKQTDFANQGDTISRQAAIDALGGNVIVTSKESAQAVMDYIRGCADRIRSLPSAQPEQNAYVVTYQDGDEEPVLSVFNNEVAAIAYRDEEGKNHDRIWLDEVPIFSKTLVDGRWFG